MEPSFLKEYVASQRQIYSYLLMLEPNRADADELMQKTAIALWDKWKTGPPPREFLPWALGFARIEVLRYRQSRKRSRLAFDTEMIETVADNAANFVEQSHDKSDALHDCVEKLPVHQRRVVRLRYSSCQSVQEIADQLDRTTAAIYKMLGRAQRSLLECIQQSLAGSK